MVVPFPDHYDYDIISTCECPLCIDYRSKVSAYMDVVNVRRQDKTIINIARTALNAAANKRDLMTEMAAQVRERTDREAVLNWLYQYIIDPDRDDKWWTNKKKQESINRWLMRFKNAATRANSAIIA